MLFELIKCHQRLRMAVSSNNSISNYLHIFSTNFQVLTSKKNVIRLTMSIFFHVFPCAALNNVILINIVENIWQFVK